jgi:hypothetical protein
MAVTLTSDKTVYGYLEAGLLTVAGGAANTAYIVTVNNPNGGITRYTVTTDGSGNATLSLVSQHRGGFTASIRPAAEHNGTTTAAATLNFKGA